MSDTLLFFDTETTGLPLWGAPSNDPEQPYIVQMAALIVDAETRRNIQGTYMVIRPDDWTVPDDLVEIHGLSTDLCERFGVPLELALQIFDHYVEMADIVVGHNVAFDKRMLRISYKRRGDSEDKLLEWKEKDSFCTATASNRICKLPATEKMIGAGRGKQTKRPTLEEAYTFFTGAPQAVSHEAMADVVACKRVYFGIKDNEQTGKEPT